MSLKYKRKLCFARRERRSSERRSLLLGFSRSPALPISATTTSPPAVTWKRPTTPMSKPTPRSSRRRSPAIIAEVLVADNEQVKAGQLLARIDDRDFKTALRQAQADVAASEAAVKNFNSQIELQEPLIQQQAAEVDAAEANLKFAQQERARYDELMKSGSGTVQRAQQTDATLRAQTAQLQQGKSGLIAANKKIEVLVNRTRESCCAARPCPCRRTAGRTEPVLYADHRAGRRYGRSTNASRRPICPGRNAADGGGAARSGLCGR